MKLLWKVWTQATPLWRVGALVGVIFLIANLVGDYVYFTMCFDWRNPPRLGPFAQVAEGIEAWAFAAVLGAIICLACTAIWSNRLASGFWAAGWAVAALLAAATWHPRSLSDFSGSTLDASLLASQIWVGLAVVTGLSRDTTAGKMKLPRCARRLWTLPRALSATTLPLSLAALAVASMPLRQWIGWCSGETVHNLVRIISTWGTTVIFIVIAWHSLGTVKGASEFWLLNWGIAVVAALIALHCTRTDWGAYSGIIALALVQLYVGWRIQRYSRRSAI